MDVKRCVALGLVTLAISGCFMGCSSEAEENQAILNASMLDAINVESSTEAPKHQVFDSITFAGADFNKVDEHYNIDVSGIATKDGNKTSVHYVNMEYEVECSFFENISKNSSAKLYKALNYIIQNYEMKNFSSVEVKSVDTFNNSVEQTLQGEDGYTVHKSFTYGIDNLQFGSDGIVSFDVRQNVDYKKTTIEMERYYNGMGYQYRSVSKTKHKDVNQSHKISIKVSEEEMSALKQDNSLVIDKFIELVETKNTSQYKVERLSSLEGKLFDDGISYGIEK